MSFKIEEAIKNILFTLMTDFETFKEMNSFNYTFTEKDFIGVGKRLFSLCLEQKAKGHKKLTSKMVTDSGIKEEEVREYFKDVELTDKENFKIYMKELSVTKAIDETTAKVFQIVKGFTELKGGYENFEQVEQMLTEMKKEVTRIPSLMKSEKGQNLIELNAAFQDISVSQLPIKTGLKEIDDVIGGFRRGETSLLSGVSNQGKTTFANQIMVYIAYVLGLRVLYINLELTDKNAYAKALGLLSGKGYSVHNPDSYDETKEEDIKAWGIRNDKDMKILNDTVGDRMEIRTQSINEEGIINTIFEAEAEGFDVIFVDYFQLIDVGTDDKKGKAQKLSDLATSIRNAVKETNLAMVLLTQLKENKKEEPMTFEISWCRDLYKTAGLELRVWREYLDESEGTFTNEIHCGFPKTRFSERPAPMPFLFDGAVGRIGSFASIDDNAVSAEDGRHLKNSNEEYAELFSGKPSLLDLSGINVTFVVELERAAKERKKQEELRKGLESVVKDNRELFGRNDSYNEKTGKIDYNGMIGEVDKEEEARNIARMNEESIAVDEFLSSF